MMTPEDNYVYKYLYYCGMYYQIVQDRDDLHFMLKNVVTLDEREFTETDEGVLFPARARAWNAFDVLSEMASHKGKLEIVGRGEECRVYIVSRITNEGVYLRLLPDIDIDDEGDRFVDYKTLFAGYKLKNWEPCGVFEHLVYKPLSEDDPLYDPHYSDCKFQKWVDDSAHGKSVMRTIKKMEKLMKTGAKKCQSRSRSGTSGR